MRLDDHMMTILTGLVFAIVLGTMAQNSDSMMALFSDEVEMQVEDDVFFVRAGTKTNIDLLANDYAEAAISSSQVRITANPTCGALDVSDEGVFFHSSNTCDGIVKFAYCVEAGGSCSPAEVLLNVREAPKAVADAYLPKKGDLVPLPLSRVEKKAPVNRVGASLEQAVKINAFVVTFESQINTDSSGDSLPRADELAKYLIDTSSLDLTRSPITELATTSTLHTIQVPMSATRTARFLREYSKDQESIDPARTYDTSVFNSDADLALSNETQIEDSAIEFPAENQTVASLETSLPKPELSQQLPETESIIALRTDPSVAELEKPKPNKAPQVAGEEIHVEKPVPNVLEGSVSETSFEPALSLPPRTADTATTNVVVTSADFEAPSAIDAKEEQANACSVQTGLISAPGAHVKMNIHAPCHTNQAVVVRHAGIEFAFNLDAEGSLIAEIPAMTKDPKVKVLIAESDPLYLSVANDDVELVQRSVVITREGDGLRLAAVEFDLKTAQDRLTTAQSSISHRDAYLAGRGYVRAYEGKDGAKIEVYTLPMSHRVAGGIVKLNLIEGIGDVVCAKRAVIDFLHVGSRANRIQTTEVSIPDCSSDYALGDVIGNIRVATR